MSDTPKTDAFISKFYKSRPLSSGSRHRTDVELHDFARQLERELTALREQIKWVLHELKTAADRLTDCQQTTISARDCIGRVEAAMKEEGK